jgi:hypothetical protein
MKQGRRAVEECDEGKRQAGMAVRGAAKLHSELPLDEFERGHVLFLSEGHGPVLRDEAVIVRMGDEEIEGAAASVQRRARGPDGGEKVEAGAAAKQGEEIPFVREAFVERRGSGASGAGDSTHRECFFAALAPDAIRGVEDAAFQKSISSTRHAATLLVSAALNYILYSVKPTVYK